MGSKLYRVLFLIVLTCAPHVTHDHDPDVNLLPSGYNWEHHKALTDERHLHCVGVKPTPRDIIRRIYAILPYFNREHQNTLFLQKYRVTINMMSEGSGALDREASFYAAVLTPIIFLQQYRDTWCLIERFQHALRQYQTASTADKRNALKSLQTLRDINNKIRLFIGSLPDPKPPTRTPADQLLELKDDDITDKKDIRFLKELIKNLG